MYKILASEEFVGLLGNRVSEENYGGLMFDQFEDKCLPKVSSDFGGLILNTYGFKSRYTYQLDEFCWRRGLRVMHCGFSVEGYLVTVVDRFAFRDGLYAEIMYRGRREKVLPYRLSSSGGRRCKNLNLNGYAGLELLNNAKEEVFFDALFRVIESLKSAPDQAPFCPGSFREAY